MNFPAIYEPEADFDLNLPVVEAHLFTTSRSDPVQIVFLGDVHIGASATDEGFVRQIAKRLTERNTWWVDMGDSCEFINRLDKRFNPRDISDWCMEPNTNVDICKAQMNRYAEIFKPVAKKCICRLKGNHEDAIVAKWERDVYAELAEKMHIPETTFLGYAGFLRLIVSRGKEGDDRDTMTLTGYLEHGHGGGILAGGAALNLERMLMAWEADFFGCGHTHKKQHIEKRRIGVNSHKPTARDKPVFAFNVGSCRRGMSSYEKRKGYYPQGIGPYELWIWPDKQMVKLIG